MKKIIAITILSSINFMSSAQVKTAPGILKVDTSVSDNMLLFKNKPTNDFSIKKVEIAPKNFTVDTTLFKNMRLFKAMPTNDFGTGKVKILPQDNMPCFVPNTTSIAQIPNTIDKQKLEWIADIPNPLRNGTK